MLLSDAFSTPFSRLPFDVILNDALDNFSVVFVVSFFIVCFCAALLLLHLLSFLALAVHSDLDVKDGAAVFRNLAPSHR